MAKKKVLILGGGFAGARLATLLSDKAEVTMVDKKAYYEIVFANARAAVEPDITQHTIIPFEELKPHGKFILGEVEKLTSKQAWIKGQSEPIEFDYCIICTGSDYAYGKSSVPTIEGRTAEVQATFAALKGASSVLVVGGGSLGVEIAGEVLTDFPDKKVTLVHSRDRLLPDMTTRASAAALAWLKKHNCEVLLNDKVDFTGKQLTPGTMQSYTTSSDKKVDADVVFVATGIKVNSSFMSEDLAAALEPDSKAIKVDQYLRVEGHPHIFAVGDVNNVPEQKLAFLAKKQAELTAKNLLAMIQAEEKGRTAKLSAWWPSAGMSVQFLSIGRSYGVGQIGWLTFTGLIPTYIKAKGIMNFVNMYRSEMLLPA